MSGNLHPFRLTKQIPELEVERIIDRRKSRLGPEAAVRAAPHQGVGWIGGLLTTSYRIVLPHRSRSIALIALYTAAYVALVYLFPFLSFLQLNIRVADCLRGLLPFFPPEMILANALGTALANTQSPLGLLDVVVSPVVVLVSTTVAAIVFKKSILGGYVAHSLILSTWLTTLLSVVLEVPWVGLAPLLYGGNVVSDIVMPYLFFRVLKTRLVYPGRRSAPSQTGSDTSGRP